MLKSMNIHFKCLFSMNVSYNQMMIFKILRMSVSVWIAEMTPRDPIYPMPLQRTPNYTIASLFYD